MKANKEPLSFSGRKKRKIWNLESKRHLKSFVFFAKSKLSRHLELERFALNIDRSFNRMSNETALNDFSAIVASSFREIFQNATTDRVLPYRILSIVHLSTWESFEKSFCRTLDRCVTVDQQFDQVWLGFFGWKKKEEKQTLKNRDETKFLFEVSWFLLNWRKKTFWSIFRDSSSKFLFFYKHFLKSVGDEK